MAEPPPAGPIAAGWAVLHFLGEDGDLRLTEDTYRAARALRSAIEDLPGLAVRGDPDATVLAFGGDGARSSGSNDAASTDTSVSIDTFALGDALADRGGWYFDRQSPPDSLHGTVHAGHA